MESAASALDSLMGVFAKYAKNGPNDSKKEREMYMEAVAQEYGKKFGK